MARRRAPLLASLAVALTACTGSPVSSASPSSLRSATGTAKQEATTSASGNTSGITSPSAPPSPSVPPTPVATERLQGQADATRLATAPGTLGMTVPRFIARYNAHLDQGEYPVRAKPEAISDRVFQVTPRGAKDTTILFVTNDDGTLRSVTALSDAAMKADELDRRFAQLEAMFVWSTVAIAASPDMSENDANSLLGVTGLTGREDFGHLYLTGVRDTVRYTVMETDEGTDFIVTEAVD